MCCSDVWWRSGPLKFWPCPVRTAPGPWRGAAPSVNSERRSGGAARSSSASWRAAAPPGTASRRPLGNYRTPSPPQLLETRRTDPKTKDRFCLLVGKWVAAAFAHEEFLFLLFNYFPILWVLPSFSALLWTLPVQESIKDLFFEKLKKFGFY